MIEYQVFIECLMLKWVSLRGSIAALKDRKYELYIHLLMSGKQVSVGGNVLLQLD